MDNRFPPPPAPDRPTEQRTWISTRLRVLTTGVAVAGAAATTAIAVAVSLAPGGSTAATNASDGTFANPADAANPATPADPANPLTPADPVVPDDQFGVQPFQPNVNDVQPPTRSGGRGHASTGGS